MRRRRWTVVLAILGAVLAAPGTAKGRQAEDPYLQSVEGHAAVSDVAAPTTVSGNGPCWYWARTWTQRNPYGDVQYRPHYRVTWCANKARTKVISPFSHYCTNKGGYAEYLGCDKWRGLLAQYAVPIDATWRYRMCFANVTPCLYRTAHLEGKVKASGVIVGTIHLK